MGARDRLRGTQGGSRRGAVVVPAFDPGSVLLDEIPLPGFGAGSVLLDEIPLPGFDAGSVLFGEVPLPGFDDASTIFGELPLPGFDADSIHLSKVTARIMNVPGLTAEAATDNP